jgi:hypothetical protein
MDSDSDNMMHYTSDDESEESSGDDTVCHICGRGDREHVLLLCSGAGCLYAAHCDCLTPSLPSVPAEDWFCPRCAHRRRPRTPPQRRVVRMVHPSVMPTTSHVPPPLDPVMPLTQARPCDVVVVPDPEQQDLDTQIAIIQDSDLFQFQRRRRVPPMQAPPLPPPRQPLRETLSAQDWHQQQMAAGVENLVARRNQNTERERVRQEGPTHLPIRPRIIVRAPSVPQRRARSNVCLLEGVDAVRAEARTTLEGLVRAGTLTDAQGGAMYRKVTESVLRRPKSEWTTDNVCSVVRKELRRTADT